MVSKRFTFAVAFTVIALTVAGCSGGDGGSSDGGTTVLPPPPPPPTANMLVFGAGSVTPAPGSTINAGREIRFTPDTFTLKEELIFGGVADCGNGPAGLSGLRMGPGDFSGHRTTLDFADENVPSGAFCPTIELCGTREGGDGTCVVSDTVVVNYTIL